MTTEATTPTTDNDQATAGTGAADAAAAATAGEGGGDETSILGGAEGGQATGEGQEGAPKEGEGAEGGDKGAAAGAPEKYELTPPDGFEQIDADALAEAEPVLRELNLNNEQAQKLMPAAANLVKRTLDRAEKAITDRAIAQRKEWADAFEADQDLGGANKAKTLADAARAFDHYGIKPGEGLRQLLDESGLGNHPDMIRFVARIGRDLDEGSFERGGAGSESLTPAERFYGKGYGKPQTATRS